MQVSFHKRATNYKAVLRKMKYTDKGILSPPPCCQTGGKCATKHTDVLYLYDDIHILHPYMTNAFIYHTFIECETKDTNVLHPYINIHILHPYMTYTSIYDTFIQCATKHPDVLHLYYDIRILHPFTKMHPCMTHS